MLFVALALLSIGCASRAPRPAAGTDGDVDYAVLPPQGEGHTALRLGQAAIGGKPHDDAVVLPAYPPAWLSQRLPEVRAEALVVIDEQGAPRQIEVDHAALAGQCGTCADDFAASVRVALQQWRFAPLEITDWIDGPDDDGDGEPDSVRRGSVGSRPYSLRLAFRFGWREGRPVVDHSP